MNITDRIKLIFDFFKHLTTLNIGCILLLVALLERNFKQPVDRFQVTQIFALFISSFFFSFGGMIVPMVFPLKSSEHEDYSYWIIRFAVLMVIIGIATGICFYGGIRGMLELGLLQFPVQLPKQ